MRAAGSMLLGLVVVACTPTVSPSPAVGVIEVRAVAGPVCPVETVPPDPACAPRAVAGADIFVMPADGRDVIVAQGTTDDEGLVQIEAPFGSYVVVGAVVPGLMNATSPTRVVLGSEPVMITVTYDTGIR